MAKKGPGKVRSAVDGEYKPKSEAKKNPKQTVTEHDKPTKTKTKKK